MSEFPQIKFGRCNRCGGQAADDPTPGTGNVPATDTTGSGLVLVWHDGKLVCEMCKNTLIAEEESLIVAEKHAEEEKFRDQAGFVRSI